MKKELGGFTLVELLVVIAIIGILTSMSFWGYGERQRELKLQRETNILVSKAEQIREKALSGKHFCPDTLGRGIFPVGGYGIHFSQGTSPRYIIFADCNNNGAYDPTGILCDGRCAETIEIVGLDNAISVVAQDITNIIFNMPSPAAPTVRIIGNSSVKTEIRDTTKFRTVFFNLAGLIYAQ